MADRIGQQLGNYRLTRLLGKGGFAEVYLGEHLRLHTQAAVKVLYARLVSHDEVEGFEKEAPTISPEVEQVVLTALEKDPHRRFEGVQAFATALEQACQRVPLDQVALPMEVPLPTEPSLPSEAGTATLPAPLSQAMNMGTLHLANLYSQLLRPCRPILLYHFTQQQRNVLDDVDHGT